MNRIKNAFGVVLGMLLFFPAFIEAQTAFAQGEELIMRNRPQEALRFLQAAAAENPSNVQAFLYLGIAYLQTDRVDDAIAAYRQILPRGGAETARIAYNLGNAYFMKENYGLAREYYSQAITHNPSYASAYLNRANSLVSLGEMADAIRDYEEYLTLEPGSPQRGQILALIALFREEITASEQERVMAEEAARIEAERRRRLLEEITESLQSAVAGSTSLSAGSEDVHDYDGAFELE